MEEETPVEQDVRSEKKAEEQVDELMKFAEEVVDKLEKVLDHPSLTDYAATIVIKQDEEGTDVTIEVEGGGSVKYRDLIDKHVHLAVREARESVEQRFGGKNKARSTGAGKNQKQSV